MTPPPHTHTSCHPKIKVHFLCLIILVWPLSVPVPKMGAKKKLTCKAPIHCLLLPPTSELYNSSPHSIALSEPTALCFFPLKSIA